jgi:carbamoyltransferase
MTFVSVLESDGHLAAALAADGVLRSALIRQMDRTDPPANTVATLLAEVCRIAQVEPEAIDRIVRVGRSVTGDERPLVGSQHVPGAIRTDVTAADALLRVLRSWAAGDAALLVVDPHGCAGAAADMTSPSRHFSGIADVVEAAKTLSIALGSGGRHPFADLERHATGPDDHAPVAFDRILRLQSDGSFETAPTLLAGVIADAREKTANALADANSVHTTVERVRSALAKGFLQRVAELIVQLADSWRQTVGARSIVLGGGLMSTVELATLVRARLDSGDVAPIAQDVGAVLGGALMDQPPGREIEHLSLGPQFDDHQIKEVIENCRLEYLYEPEWSRLCSRVSCWIAGGSTVGWFQGRLEFGRQSLGSRSLLADPSHRYARENLNLYLLDRPLAARLPVSLAPSAVNDCVDHRGDSPFAPALEIVKPASRASLAAGLDSNSRCLIHVPRHAVAPELVTLLETHRARTGVPGLLNASFERSPAELVETPRQAIRAAFGSAVDILVMGRFLIAKDYWLMRQRVA